MVLQLCMWVTICYTLAETSILCDAPRQFARQSSTFPTTSPSPKTGSLFSSQETRSANIHIILCCCSSTIMEQVKDAVAAHKEVKLATSLGSTGKKYGHRSHPGPGL